jgi:ELWxxDGT repeat protein
VLGKAFYFAAGDLSHGTELWKSDGTNNGTVLVKDILPGTKSSIPYHLTRHQNELFFVVGETSNGKDALWKTDGTPEGTVQIKQIAGANTFSYIRNLFSWGPYLYFSADDGIHGQELWRSDGTEEGTTMLADLNAGSASSDPENFTPFKSDLYFSANDGIHGYELWRLLSDNVVSIDEPHMAEILVFPNPAIDQLVVRRNVENGKLVARLFDANGRTVVQPTLLNEESTELNVNTLPNGIYFLEIRAEGSLERKVKKIVIVR